MYTYLTNHSKTRMKERNNIKNIEKMIRQADLAYTRGKLARVHSDGTCAIEFSGFCYIFAGEDLITDYRIKKFPKNRRRLLEEASQREERYEMEDEEYDA